jgi:hypothetical protein
LDTASPGLRLRYPQDGGAGPVPLQNVSGSVPVGQDGKNYGGGLKVGDELWRRKMRKSSKPLKWFERKFENFLFDEKISPLAIVPAGAGRPCGPPPHPALSPLGRGGTRYLVAAQSAALPLSPRGEGRVRGRCRIKCQRWSISTLVTGTRAAGEAGPAPTLSAPSTAADASRHGFQIGLRLSGVTKVVGVRGHQQKPRILCATANSRLKSQTN